MPWAGDDTKRNYRPLLLSLIGVLDSEGESWGQLPISRRYNRHNYYFVVTVMVIKYWRRATIRRRQLAAGWRESLRPLRIQRAEVFPSAMDCEPSIVDGPGIRRPAPTFRRRSSPEVLDRGPRQGSVRGTRSFSRLTRASTRHVEQRASRWSRTNFSTWFLAILRCHFHRWVVEKPFFCSITTARMNRQMPLRPAYLRMWDQHHTDWPCYGRYLVVTIASRRRLSIESVLSIETAKYSRSMLVIRQATRAATSRLGPTCAADYLASNRAGRRLL